MCFSAILINKCSLSHGGRFLHTSIYYHKVNLLTVWKSPFLLTFVLPFNTLHECSILDHHKIQSFHFDLPSNITSWSTQDVLLYGFPLSPKIAKGPAIVSMKVGRKIHAHNTVKTFSNLSSDRLGQ
jgi:hypothetical protein